VATHAALVRSVALASVGAALAFLLILAELLLVRATSGLTLAVAGVFKEVLTICASIALLGDEVTPINAAGLSLTLVGVGVYNVMMLRRRMREGGDEGMAAASPTAAGKAMAHASYDQQQQLELSTFVPGGRLVPPRTPPSNAPMDTRNGSHSAPSSDHK